METVVFDSIYDWSKNTVQYIDGFSENCLVITVSSIYPTMADNKLGNVQHSIKENGRFQNPWSTWSPPTVRNLLRFLFGDADKSSIPKPEVKC